MRCYLRLLALIGGLGLSSTGLAAGDHVITAQDIAMLDQVSAPRLSPDGHHVIYTVRTPVAGSAKPGPARLWQTTTAPGGSAQPLAHSRAGDNDPRWAPGGRRVAFLRSPASDDASGKTQADATDGAQIWIATPAGSVAQRLTRLAGAVTDFRWSPDGGRIAAIVHVPASGGGKAATPHSVDDPDGQDLVYLVDAKSGTAHAVSGADRHVFDVAWGPQGQQLLVRYGRRATPEYYWYRSHVGVLDLASGDWTTVLPHHATAVHPSFSPNGRRVVYGYFQPNGITAAVAVHDLENGHDIRLGGDWAGDLRSLRWNRDGRHLTALAFSHMTPMLVQVDAETGSVSDRRPFKGDPFEFSRAGNGALAYVASTRARPAQIWFDSSAGDAHELTDINPQTASWQTADVQRVHWQSTDGEYSLNGLLVTPADGKPPYRTLVEVHGGPYESWYDGWQGSWVNWSQLLAANGYAVFLPNPRGSAGRSTAFALANRHDWGGGDFSDILAGVHALADRGVIDIEHLAIGGWSYGGFMSAWAAGHDDPFKAAIVGAGISDLQSMALTTDVGLSFIPPYFSDPSRRRAEYAAHSPINFVHDVHMPVLLLHGEADTRVPFFQSRMFHRALAHDTDQPTELIGYPGAPHWFGYSVGAGYRADVQRRVLGWLNRYLGPAGSAQK